MPCVFCGHRETSNEHVFPAWLPEVMPGAGRLVHRWQAPPDTDAQSREWTNRFVSFKANVVCRDNCNSGWMSRLEGAARPLLEPMIRGERQTLSSAQQQVVAYWALKTTMMIDFAQEEEFRSVPPADYARLYKAGTVLPNTFVWLAAAEFGRGALAQHRTLEFGLDGHTLNGYGGVVNVGHLVISVVKVDFGNGRVINIGGPLGPALVPLWPTRRTLQWPPDVWLNRQQTVLLGQMIEASPTTLTRAP